MNINVLNVCLDPLLFLCSENIQTFSLISIIVNLDSGWSVVLSPWKGFKVNGVSECHAVLTAECRTVSPINKL